MKILLLFAAIAAGADETAAPRGGTPSGEVVDEAGRPVAGAWINATWRHQDQGVSTFTIRQALAISDAKGRFALKSISRDFKIEVWSHTPQRASIGAMRVAPGDDDPIRLEVRPEGVARVEGRVVDREGKPIAEAKIVVRGGGRNSYKVRKSDIAANPRDHWEMTSDAQGRFAVPQTLNRIWKYNITVEAPGRVSHRANGLTIPADAKSFVLPDVVLDPIVTLQGEVVDRDGKPVGKATVSASSQAGMGQTTSVESDNNGVFELPNVHPEARFVFAEAQGFRFHGMALPPGEERLRIVLTRIDEALDEPPLASRRLPEAQRRELLKRLLSAVFEKGEQVDSEYARTQSLVRLAPYDPAYVAERVGAIRSITWRSEVLLALDRVDEVLLAAQAIEEEGSVVYVYHLAADRVDDREQKLAILAQAMTHVRAVQNPMSRVSAFAQMAEKLYDLGQRDAARKLIDEALPLAQELGVEERNGFVRGYFAETLALFDQAAAMELIKDVGKGQDFTFARHRGNIAHELAAIDPAAAEQILEQIAGMSFEYARYAPRVCYRMAPVDLERARAIAAKTSLETRAWAYGVMARALARQSPDVARSLLREAFEQFRPLHDAQTKRGAFPVAMFLVRIAEEVDPPAAREYLWRAIALHPGPDTDPRSEKVVQLEQDARLAILLSLYGVEPEVAQELAAGAFEYAQSFPPSQYVGHNGIDAMITAMALVDPERAIQWHEGYLPNATAKDLNYLPQAFKLIADAIGQAPEDFWDRLQGELFWVWVVDKED